MESEKNKRSVVFYKTCFLILGFCGAIPWFSILSTLDFFVQSYREFNVPLTIILPNFLGQGVFCILIYFISFIISLKARVIGGLLSIAITLVGIFVIPVITPDQPLYWLILFLVFILGSANIIYQTSTTALCYIFPKEYSPIFFLGNSLAGVFLILVRVVFLKTLENAGNPLVGSTFGLLAINTLILLAAVLFYQKLATSTLYFSCLYREYAQSLAQSIVGSLLYDFSSLKHFENYESGKLYEENLIENPIENGLSSKVLGVELPIKTDNMKSMKSMEYRSMNCGEVHCSTDSLKHLQRNKNRLDFEFFASIFRKISPMMFLVLLLCIQSLFVFPGMVLQKPLFIEVLNESWNSILWIFLFNLSDLLAKFITLWPIKLRINTFRALVFLRFLFWGSFILINNSPEGSLVKNDWFCLVHLVAFGVSGGVLINGLMFVALECGKNNEKETIGLLISIPLVYGNMIGSFLALFSKFI